MYNDDEESQPKPLVSYDYLPDEEEDYKPDILDKLESIGKMPFDFGSNKNLINSEIRKEINEYHKVKEPEKIYVPYEIDMEEKDLVGPPIPSEFKKDDSDHSEEEYYEDDIAKQIPITHVVDLHHTENKSVNTLDIDRSGNRLITGCMDGTIKIWDFTSMNRRPAATHTIEAGNNYPIMSLSWAPSGGFFLAAIGDCQAKIYDRDGNLEIGCLKGDNYLHDIGNTKGHTYPLTDGKWHPIERNLFITASRDSTVRVWDIYSKPMGIEQSLMQISLLKAKTNKNHKIPVNSCNYSNDGKLIIAGVNDGTIQMWSHKTGYWRPDVYMLNAHLPGSEITSVLFSDDGQKFFSRADDSTMKMWDIRWTDKPVKTWDNLPSFSTKTGMTLSPDESIIITGTSVKKGHENSSMVFYSTYNYEKIKELKICRNSLTSIVWNRKLNQIALGSTDGICRMYFNPELSNNGIVNTIYKKARTKEIDDIDYVRPIITPLVLPLFDEVNFNRKTYLDIVGGDKGPKQKVELPIQGPGSKSHRPASVTTSIMQSIHKRIYEEKDNRETLLKFGDKGKEWVDSAYRETQPKQIFDNTTPLEEEVKYFEQTVRKRCHGCGLKFCTCNKTIFQLPIQKKMKKN
jgi:WD40 repeat protein